MLALIARYALIALALVLVAPGVASLAHAQEQEPPSIASLSLDEAFERLVATTDRDEAKQVERHIIRLWLDSGSDTIDLLMSWVLRAIDEEDYATALDYLDRVILLKPDYVEGWNKRATVFFLTDQYAKAIADIERVLEIEPRHFGAMSGLGIMLREIGEEDRAIEVFERALEIDPVLDNVRDELRELKDSQEGPAI